MSYIKACGVLLILLLSTLGVNAQTPEYFMTDTTVTDCDGFLFDSGGPDDSYSNNENLTFTVDTGGESIVVTFLDEICIETGFDFLYIYDGDDTDGVLLATVSGTGVIPPTVTAVSGAITFHFTSDPSANYCGFHIFWDTIVGPPEPPVISVEEPDACGVSSFVVDFSYAIGCDWLSPDSISVTGNGLIEVVDANVLCSAGTGTQALIELAQPLDYNCDFFVTINMGIPDVCDSVWVYPLFTTFTLDVCPVNGFIVASDTLFCAGGCTELTAFALGCNDHTFEWNNGLPAGEGPHLVCPEETTTYEVVITETATGNSSTESILIEVIDSQILMPDTAICRTEPAFQIPLEGSASGVWEGPGIIDEDTGVFLADSANIGLNTIVFVSQGLCSDTLIIEVLQIDAGGITAACPGSPEFQLEAEPPGGTWEGDFVTPMGLFDPSTEGSYTLTYTFDGCQDTLRVNVADIAGQFDLDTLCQSNWADTIPFSPLGGVWSGPGIIDTLNGVFDPGEVPEGAYNLLYEVEGCSQIFEVYVKEIFTGSRVRSSCPEQDPFIPTPDFSPIGGFWEGNGIIDPLTGMYDPGSIPNDFWTALIYYAPNGCSDTIFYYNRQTFIPIDTLWWCSDQEGMILDNETTGRTPFGGSWFGAGVVNPEGNDFFFIPALAGNGHHTLVYDANGCTDSLVMVVHPPGFDVGPFGFCSNEEGVVLNPSLPEGGMWSGAGITDSSAGHFDPSQASIGTYEVFWETSAGCSAAVQVTVEEFQQASLLGLDEIYCFENIDYAFTAIPPGGGITGETSPGFFNPSQAGTGFNALTYSWSGEYCASDTTIEVFVYPALEVTLSTSESVICQNAATVLTGEAAGGGEDSFYTFIWSDGLFPVSSNTVSPSASQWYYLTIDDGCSDVVTDSVFIEVLPPIQTLVTTSDSLCFGVSGGFANAEVTTPGSFEIEWSGNGEVSGNSITTTAGAIVELNITDAVYGCTFDSLILVPSYSPVNALFSTSPNADCIPWDSQPIELIDFSQHGVTGIWELGNGEVEPYVSGDRFFFSFDQAGDLTVTLTITNEGDCEASYSLDVCVLPPTPIFIPDIFSPNDDGLNDMLYVRGRGIIDMTFLVYDRWGEKVFESNHPDHGWDGRYRGANMPSGSYVWVLSARLNDGSTEEMRGNVKLVR